MSLPDLLAGAVRHGPSLHAVIGDTWLQGRTAYGGLSAAIALHAVKQTFGDLPPLLSAQIAFVGPVAGSVVATPSLLRRGKNSAFVACPLTTSEGAGIHALFLFMAPRASAIAHHALPAPDVPLDAANLIDTSQLPQGFLGQFEMPPWRMEQGQVRRWTRLRDRAGLDPEVELITIADALPPAAMSLVKQWGPISTTTWQLNLVTEAPATRDGWWLLEAETPHAADGNSTQTMTIWNRDGEAVATATQSVALFV